jgi:hypothetical protein
MRRVILSLLAAALTLALTASVALAGEITGSGTLLEVNGRSECAFSGLDEPDPLDGDMDDALFGRTQSWGQIPKAIRAGFPHPGVACNPVK